MSKPGSPEWRDSVVCKDEWNLAYAERTVRPDLRLLWMVIRPFDGMHRGRYGIFQMARLHELESDKERAVTVLRAFDLTDGPSTIPSAWPDDN